MSQNKQDKHRQDNQWTLWVNHWKNVVSEWDFWWTFGIAVGFIGIAILFFWLALGFDFANKVSMVQNCRKVSDGKAFFLIVSPLVILLTSILAAGELMNQLEEHQKFHEKFIWWKLILTISLSLGCISISALLMKWWC